MSQSPKRDPRGLDDIDAGCIPPAAFSDVDGPKGRPGVPRIYYATRTHSQISQVRERKKERHPGPLRAYTCTPTTPCLARWLLFIRHWTYVE